MLFLDGITQRSSHTHIGNNVRSIWRIYRDIEVIFVPCFNWQQNNVRSCLYSHFLSSVAVSQVIPEGPRYLFKGILDTGDEEFILLSAEHNSIHMKSLVHLCVTRLSVPLHLSYSLVEFLLCNLEWQTFETFSVQSSTEVP